jgi:uncharacterized repeat protein (TIGR01451 family)
MYALALATATVPAAVSAQSQVSLTSHIAVERITTSSDGKQSVRYEDPKLVTPGDRLAFTLEYTNTSQKPADHFVVTDPIPSGVAFADHESTGAAVSVDGGKTFGPLSSLQMVDANGAKRAAVAGDVTHIRWSFARTIAPGEHGELKFEGVVK